MSELLFDLPKPVTIPVNGETAEYPIGRIFCVGRNYAAHAAEMGFEVDREAPRPAPRALRAAAGHQELSL